MDWNIIGQFVGHVIAFFLFFLILKKYAWPPVLNLIDERNARIEAGFTRAEEAEIRAQELKEQYERRIAEIEAEARERINEAVNEGRRASAELVEAARADAQRLQRRAKETLDLEIAKARIELKDDVVRLTIAATEKLIRERLDEPGHRRLIGEFVEELSKRQ